MRQVQNRMIPQVQNFALLEFHKVSVGFILGFLKVTLNCKSDVSHATQLLQFSIIYN